MLKRILTDLEEQVTQVIRTSSFFNPLLGRADLQFEGRICRDSQRDHILNF
jgi:hypothetical protein